MRLLFPQLFWRLRVVALSLLNINGLIQDGDFILQPHRHARKLIEPPWNRPPRLGGQTPALFRLVAALFVWLAPSICCAMCGQTNKLLADSGGGGTSFLFSCGR